MTVDPRPIPTSFQYDLRLMSEPRSLYEEPSLPVGPK